MPEWLKKFFARFYSDEPTMLMPAVPQPKQDEDFTPEQRAAALHHQHHSGDGGGDDAPADDVNLPPGHGPAGG